MLYFSPSFLDRVAARNDPKCPRGWQIKYAERVQREFSDMKFWMPQRCHSLLNIGSGFAGIDALLVRHFHYQNVHLVDGDGSRSRSVGFHANLLPWNDVRIGAQFLMENANCLVTMSIVPPCPEPWKADLIISLKSWGHHYPVREYLQLAQKSLNDGGVIIMDIRKGTNGVEDMLQGGFVLLAEIGGTMKTDRMAFVRS